MIIKKLIYYIFREPKKLVCSMFLFLAHKKGIGILIPSKWFIKAEYKKFLGKRLNLKNPRTYNEKLQWLKLYDIKSEYTNMVDKYEVRKYITDTIGAEYLIPLLGVYNTFEEINVDHLPNKFVLKPNHTSGNIYICKDKSKIDYIKLKKEVTMWLKRKYFWVHREWPYKNIKPRIICEEFISDKDITPDDYKVLCFNGKAKLVEVHIDRFGNYKQDYYDEKWNKKSMRQGGTPSDIIYPKPIEFEKMIQLSEKLAANMFHVRIDWFIVYDKLYFGEITFYHASGFDSFDAEEDDYLLGSWITLPI